MAQTRKQESSTGLAETKERVKPVLLDEEDDVVTAEPADPLADYEDFADPGDTNPDDRRRDPLRR